MVIVQNSSGQLGNKLLISAHITAYCLSRNEVLINTVLGHDADYFSALSFSEHRIIVVGSRSFQRLLRLAIRVLQKAIYAFFNKSLFDNHRVGWVHTELGELARKAKTCLLLEGEGFRSTIDVHLNRQLLRKLFTPRPEHVSRVETIVSTLLKENTILIGIHLRRGDYRTWQSGKFYYDDKTYLNFIEQSKHLFKPQNVQFCLCSDEKIDANTFNANNIYISTNKAIIDLYLLSKCNYIIGPPSTFSGWASFYGEVPLHSIENHTITLSLQGFKKYTL